MIRRVLINLVENAVKYTPSDGAITIKVSAGDDEIRIGVSDTGPGIDVLDQKRIFEKFARVERKGRSKGLGLGLAFCRLAVEAHGGKIWVESGPEQGSVFYFTLPL
jgi:signal transduction histidine kinase